MAVPVSSNNLTPVNVTISTVYPFSQLTSDQLENKYFPWGSRSVIPTVSDAYNKIAVASSTAYPFAQLTDDQLEHHYVPLTSSLGAVTGKDAYTKVNITSGNYYVIQTTAVSGSSELSPRVTPVQIWKTGV